VKRADRNPWLPEESHHWADDLPLILIGLLLLLVISGVHCELSCVQRPTPAPAARP
jgi:hypothetical protein